MTSARKTRPGVEHRERLLVERRAGRVQADRVVDADEERLRGERAGAPERPLGVKAAGFAVNGLRREEARFELDDLLRLERGQIDGRLGVAARRVIGLVQQVLLDCGRRRRLPAVPHHAAQEAQVGGRQRPAIERRVVGGRGAVVRIVDALDDELGRGGHVQPDANQSARQQEAVSGALARQRLRHRPFAGRAVVVGEDRIGPVTRRKRLRCWPA